MKKQITLFIFITMVIAVVTLKKVSMQGAGVTRKAAQEFSSQNLNHN